MRRTFKEGDKIHSVYFKKELEPHIQPSGQKKRKGLFVCRCGNEFETTVDNVRREHSTSCGCEAKRLTSIAKTTHGDSRSSLYARWAGIKARCYDKNSNSYERYGARGVTMCDEWKDSYEAFRDWSIDNMFSKELDIDKDYLSDKLGISPAIYSPETCMWMSKSNNNSAVHSLSGSSSKYVGVSLGGRNRDHWIAKISKDGVEHYIGYFKTENEAAIAVNEKMDELGSFHIRNKVEVKIFS